MLMLPPGKEINSFCSFDTRVYFSCVKILQILFVTAKRLTLFIKPDMDLMSALLGDIILFCPNQSVVSGKSL